MIQKYNNLTYKLSRSDRKTMSIYVGPDGGISVLAPKDLELNQIHSTLDEKSYWIFKSLAKFKELNQSKVCRQVANGEEFLYFGRSYKLRIEADTDTPLALVQGYFILHEGHTGKAKERFTEFYRTEAKRHIPDRVEYFRQRIGIESKQIRIRNLKKRWASISKTGINFHWKVMMAPMTVIDYVVVHELAHAIFPNHSHEFWELVEAVMPNYREKQNWLRINGAGLDV